MRVTLSAILANVGSVRGHLAPPTSLLRAVTDRVRRGAPGLLLQCHVSHAGDGVVLLATHRHGAGDAQVYRVAADALLAGVRVAHAEGLCDPTLLLAQAPANGAPRRLDVARAELVLDERAAEPFLLFASDKAGPGAFNLPLYLAFADPLNTPGLLLSSEMAAGFRFVVTDLADGDGARVLELVTPEELHDLAALLRHPERYAVESVWSRATRAQAAAVATRGGGRGGPVMLVRCHDPFPTTAEVLAPFQLVGHFVAGAMRGSHAQPLMPMPLGSGPSYCDGPPVLTAAAYTVSQGCLTGPVDAFAHPVWDTVRMRVADRAIAARSERFGRALAPDEDAPDGDALLPALERRFQPRSGEADAPPVAAARW